MEIKFYPEEDLKLYKKLKEGSQDYQDVTSLTYTREKVKLTAIDYSLGALSQFVTKKIIIYDHKMQRRKVWNERQQSRLIESVLMNVPIPPIFLSIDLVPEPEGSNNQRYLVIDGKQRLYAFTEFLNNRLTLKGLSVLKENNGLKFDELTKEGQSFLCDIFLLRTIVIHNASKENQFHEQINMEAFIRLNTGGIELSAQEIRNARYSGPFNDMLYKLVKSSKILSIIGIKENDLNYERMGDVELVLRFFVLKTNIEEFNGELNAQMNQFMKDYRYSRDSELSKFQDEFNKVLDTVSGIFGKYTFKTYSSKSSDVEFSIAIYDAQMISCSSFKGNLDPITCKKIKDEFKDFFSDKEFLISIKSKNINDPKSLRSRVKMFSKLFDIIREGE